MKPFRSFAVFALIVLGVLSCTHQTKRSQTAEELKDWQGKMHVLSDSLSRLLPLTSSQRVFNDPKNDSLIKQEAATIRKMAHAVESTSVKPTQDPGMTYMAEKFAGNMDEAIRQLEAGNRSNARRLLQQGTAHCINCHTRTDTGRSEMQLSQMANLNGLNGLEQMDFFIAVRDFDKALNKFDQLVNSPDAQILHPGEMEIAAEKALAIAIRVKRNPALASELVSRIIDARWAPVYLRLNASVWKKTIEAWRKQPQQKLSEKGQLDLAKLNMSQGWKLNASSPLWQAGLVHFLRASTILSDLLAQPSTSVLYGEALYYAGLAAESLRNINLWTLQDGYYEACIRHAPRTALAKKCYLRFEALQYSSFATDEPSLLPKDVSDKLIQLRNLSHDPRDMKFDWEAWGNLNP